MQKVDIVMYHYVKKSISPKFKKLNYLNFKNFQEQLNYLEKKYNIIDPAILYDDKKNLPEKSCLLTFDDGYKDHIRFVFPELKKRRIKGLFFPTGNCTFDMEVLDANLIQHILAVTKNINKLKKEIINICLELDISKKELDEKYLLYTDKSKHSLSKPKNRWDFKEVIFLKRLLQFGLKDHIRKKIIYILFKKYIKINIQNFHKNFYLNTDDIKRLLDNEMSIGSHTYNHYWLGTLSKDKQEKEINLSVEFLNHFQISKKKRIMCYPFGSYNKDTLKIMKKNKFYYAVTTKSRTADLDKDNIYELPRKDTNDYPQKR